VADVTDPIVVVVTEEQYEVILQEGVPGVRGAPGAVGPPGDYAVRVTDLDNIGTSSAPVYKPNCDTTDQARILLPQHNFQIQEPYGTEAEGKKLMILVVSDTTSYTIQWDSSYVDSGLAKLPRTQLPAGKSVRMGFIFDGLINRWVLMAADLTGY
jgi:hypothetical protein